MTNELGHQGRHRMVALEDNVTCECGWQSISGELRICLNHFNEHVQETRQLIVTSSAT